MHCKSSSMYRALIIFVCLLMILCVEGQLNFSTGWGKRSKNWQSENGENTCTPTLERVLNIYNLIQLEAQWLRNCEKSSQGSV